MGRAYNFHGSPLPDRHYFVLYVLYGKPAQSNLMLGMSSNLLPAYTKWYRCVTFRFESQITHREYHLTWFYVMKLHER
ncbi:hypothetical protein PISMIDRAFT_357635 [Pisolithus microcarpus 441]|uniref:Uncharacterized protein n=1 Tax=Pisolithus microcarpus 441 TaxID=765257 RepID=A0A0C9YKA5_9AGAM|nr:hypothetical protein PISMIDRAFT_357635 [Pisolithus microcarpus 441]